MIPLNLHYRYLLLFLISIIIKINFISNQTCTNNIPDFFYNVDFSGPFFDRAVYTISKFSVSNPKYTSIFNFTVKKQTKNTRPSYYNPTRFSSRTLDSNFDDITVISNDANFIVNNSNNTYTLLTNTYPLNYFSPFNRYLFNLTATQTFSDERQPIISTAIVQIGLMNYNVHHPMFIFPNQTFYISEDALPNTEFGTVYATDADNDGIIFHISNNDRFDIDRSTGVLRLKESFPLSSSSIEFVDIDVSITDDSSSCPSYSCSTRENSTRIRINIIPANRNSPKFLTKSCGQNISLRENSNETIELIVFDNDRGENGLINITFPPEHLRTTVSGLRNTAYSQFNLTQCRQTNKTCTAELKPKEPFDYDKSDAIRVWYLYILANDNGKFQRQALCSLRIDLLDENDNSPEFIMPIWNYTIYNSSSAISNRRILRIIAYDADSGLNGEIDYCIGTRGVPYFSIERETGIIIFQKSITDLTSSDISRFPIVFEVYAQDRGIPPRFSINNATVIINYVNNINPISARWIDQNYEELNISISEKFYELYPNRPIFQQGIFDGVISYELTSQIPSIMTVNSPFSHYTNLPFRDTSVIRNGTRYTSGIVVTSGLHAEIQDKYSLCIRVLVEPPLIGLIKINLIDENDHIPTFDIRSFVSSVIENENGYRILAQIQAFDRDITPENNRVLYRLNKDLNDNQTNEYFHVESNGTIWTNTIFNREYNRTLYRLFITAYNEKSAWNLTTNPTQDFQFDVQVIDENINEPKFYNESSIKTISISEKIKNEMIILNLTIIDEDIDTYLNLGILTGNIRNTFTFTLLSTNLYDLKRTYYQAIGQLKVVAPLDYESIQNYTLVLFASDTKNLVKLNVIIHLIPENTKAPSFDLLSTCTRYEYKVMENMSYSKLDGCQIQASDSDKDSLQSLKYKIYDPRRQLNLVNIFLNESDNYTTLGIDSPGLSRDVPFGKSEYRFGIRVTDENGTGVSSYAEIIIEVIDINNKAPIPIISSCIPQGINSTINITFIDYDDSKASNTVPYTITVVRPSNFKLIGPTISLNASRYFLYDGTLNRTLTKNFTVEFNTSDNQILSGLSTISIIVCDEFNNYPISDGSKLIEIIYIKDYQNSLRNIDLGSIYVQDLNDWYQTNREYSIDSQTYYISQGFLRTNASLNPGSSTIRVNVLKFNTTSSAVSTIELKVKNVDSEYIRHALTIRIKGEYPETILGHPLDRLCQAIASLLNINSNSIIIFSIRSVFQYQLPYSPLKTLEKQKAEALTDVIFYVHNRDKFDIKRILKDNLNQFQSRFQIQVEDIEPDPCHNYACPEGTYCRATRTIHPKPYTIDTNLTSFVGINILNSADCVNSSINAGNCSSVSLLSDGPSSSILELIFEENGVKYIEFDGEKFSNFAPTRFSFDFMVSSLSNDALILLYGRNSPPVDEFFWIAIEIYQSKLKFHFRDVYFIADQTELIASTWYHIECQFIHSKVLVTINDCQYLRTVNNTINIYDPLTVKLYLGGVPINNSVLFHLYPSLTTLNNFIGRIRNVISNGCYLTINSNIDRRISDIIIPWYTWLIMILVLLFLITILILTLLTCIKRRQQLKILTGLYVGDARENIIDYKDTAGEKDHSTYNLHVLKKPVYALSDDDNIILNNNRLNYNDSRLYHRPSLGEYIEEKLQEQDISYANDTQLHYLYEGDGSLASNLSSIQSSSIVNENDYQFLQSLGPEFSRLADL